MDAKTAKPLQASQAVMIRHPALPVRLDADSDRALASSDPDVLTAYLRSVYDDPYCRAAVAHAAWPLWEFVEKVLAGDISTKPAKLRRAAISTAKFLNRMTTRPTPFGLFAAAGEAKCVPSKELATPEFGADLISIHVDFRWLLSLVRRLESDPAILDRQTVYLNDLLKVDENQVVLYRPSTETSKQSRVAIKRSEAISAVIEACKKDGCPVATLYAELQKTTQSSHDQARRYVQKLIELGVIYTALRPKLLGQDPLEELIGNLEASGTSVPGLQSIHGALNDLAASRLNAESTFRALVDTTRRMRHIEASTDYLHITKVSGLAVELPSQILDDAETTLRLLQRLSQPRKGMRGMRAYHSTFLERYGIDRIVPLRTVVNPHTGIGVPSDYTWPEQGLGVESDYKDARSERREGRLARLYSDAIRSNRSEVHLSQEDIAELTYSEFDDDDAQDSAELYLSVVAPDLEHLRRGDYRLALGPNPGSHVGLSTAGRFLSYLPNLRSIAPLDSSGDSGEYSAVLSYAPRADSAANVGNTAPYADKIIAVNTPPLCGQDYVALDEIGIAATMTGLFVVDLRDGRRIRITANNALYPPTQAPNEVRLLSDLMHEHQRLWEPWSWGHLEYVPFTPAVRFGKVTLAPATWNLNELRQASLWLSATPQDDFAAWKARHHLPRYCLASSRDMRLLIDTENPGHVELLRHELRRDSGLVLDELPGGAATPDDAWGWLERDGQPLGNEIVVTFARSSRNQADEVPTKHSAAVASAIQRKSQPAPSFRPGGPWTSARLYLTPEEIPSVLRSHIAPAFRQLALDSPDVTPFFLRYSDMNGTHLRLRTNNGSRTGSQANEPLLAVMQELCATGAARSFTLDEYVPETHRYGGEELLGVLHAAFSEDSFMALTELSEPISPQNVYHDNYVLGAWLDTMISFGPAIAPDLADPLAIAVIATERLGIPRSIEPTYTRDRERWRRPIQSRLALHDATICEMPPAQQPRPAFQRYGHALHASIQTQSATASPERVLGSLLHMTFNRVNGPDPDNENRLLGVLRSVLLQLAEARRAQPEV